MFTYFGQLLTFATPNQVRPLQYGEVQRPAAPLACVCPYPAPAPTRCPPAAHGPAAQRLHQPNLEPVCGLHGAIPGEERMLQKGAHHMHCRTSNVGCTSATSHDLTGSAPLTQTLQVMPAGWKWLNRASPTTWSVQQQDWPRMAPYDAPEGARRQPPLMSRIAPAICHRLPPPSSDCRILYGLAGSQLCDRTDVEILASRGGVTREAAVGALLVPSAPSASSGAESPVPPLFCRALTAT